MTCICVAFVGYAWFGPLVRNIKLVIIDFESSFLPCYSVNRLPCFGFVAIVLGLNTIKSAKVLVY